LSKCPERISAIIVPIETDLGASPSILCGSNGNLEICSQWCPQEWLYLHEYSPDFDDTIFVVPLRELNFLTQVQWI
jgi:hypothetical protein